MLHFILSLPSFLMISFAILAGAGISIAALYFIRKKLHWESFKENHEVGGFLFNALGLIYAVLIAFVVFATWEDYNTAKEYCDNEADVLQSLYLNSEGLPEEYQPAIRKKILEYMKMIIEEDWPMLAKGEENPNSRNKLIDIWRTYNSIDSFKSDKEQIFFTESLDKLNSVTEFRRQRYLSSQNHIPVVVWTVIIIGALTSIGFSLFFGTRSFAVQAAMTSLFAMTNIIVILMILALDHPFIGDIKVSSDVYEQILNYLLNESLN